MLVKKEGGPVRVHPSLACDMLRGRLINLHTKRKGGRPNGVAKKQKPLGLSCLQSIEGSGLAECRTATRDDEVRVRGWDENAVRERLHVLHM